MCEDHAASEREALDELLWAMALDLKAAAVFGRAMMQGVAALSDNAAEAIDRTLERESRTVAVDDLGDHHALSTLIQDARRRLQRKDAA